MCSHSYLPACHAVCCSNAVSCGMQDNSLHLELVTESKSLICSGMLKSSGTGSQIFVWLACCVRCVSLYRLIELLLLLKQSCLVCGHRYQPDLIGFILLMPQARTPHRGFLSFTSGYAQSCSSAEEMWPTGLGNSIPGS